MARATKQEPKEDYTAAKITTAQRRAVIRQKLEMQPKVAVRIRAGRGPITLATIGGIPFKVQRHPTQDITVQVPRSVAKIAFQRYDREIPSPVVVYEGFQHDHLETVGEKPGGIGFSSDTGDGAAIGARESGGSPGDPDMGQLLSR